MWIAFHIGQLVMYAMRCNPCDRSTFQGQSAASRQKIFHPFRSLVSAMRQQPVVAHANTETASHPPQHQRHREGLPGKEKQRSNRANVECSDKKSRRPVNRLFECFVVY